ncbi:testis, prostate and placenta-expressed protein isoform X3 [Exaiptasia diaphana]|uniref:Uncharacterized protein n=1 Tax=Exaiptasia diaphana TaxID=2652724 RepID=A0A913XZ99_EXADI|nr:testis, prostate and placenta-expressed protein isoform X3 [Exaiptasia diaphana]
MATSTQIYPLYTYNKKMLASVKEGLYHPMLPTFRRMDMDTAAHKLPEDHSRTTTPLMRRDFKNATITLFKPPETPLFGTRITETGRNLSSREYKPLESGGMVNFMKSNQEQTNQDEEEYRAATGHPSSRYDPREPYTYMPEPYLSKSADQLKFNGYAARYLAPRISGGWRYSLRQEPFIDLRGQRPIPATIYSRYRNPHPLISVSTTPWK